MGDGERQGGSGDDQSEGQVAPDPNNNHKYESGVETPNEYETIKSDTVILSTAKVLTYILYGNSFTLP